MRRSLIHPFAPLVLTLVCLLLLLVAAPSRSRAASSDEIDAQVSAALKRFQKDVTSASDFLKEAKGVLVIPDVKKLGFLVGGQWGEGALFVSGQRSPVAYYRMDAGSAGFQAGYQKADFVFVFLTDDALRKFRAADKWSAGAEGGVTMIDKGFGGSVDTLKSSTPVAGFAFGKKGLMAGWSLKGTKFTRFEPDE